MSTRAMSHRVMATVVMSSMDARTRAAVLRVRVRGGVSYKGRVRLGTGWREGEGAQL